MRSKMFTIPRFLLVPLLALHGQQVALAQFAGGEKTLQRTTDPVIITGKELPYLMGKDIDNIRVFSFRGGRLQAVPFQVDERNSTGCWVWDVVYKKRFVFDDEDSELPVEREPVRRGPGTVDDEDPAGTALLDANDELVLMAKDLGDRVEITQHVKEAALILELEVSDTTNGPKPWVVRKTAARATITITDKAVIRLNLKDNHISMGMTRNGNAFSTVSLSGSKRYSATIPTAQSKKRAASINFSTIDPSPNKKKQKRRTQNVSLNVEDQT